MQSRRFDRVVPAPPRLLPIFSTEMSRRSLLRRGALVCLGLPLVGSLLAVCATDDDAAPEADPSDDATDDETDEPLDDAVEADDAADDSEAVDGPRGELVIATGADSYRTGPNRANIGKLGPNTNIFDTLVRIAPDYQIEPMLADSWEFVEPNTWRFDLRDDVVFHDGTPFTAEAVAWTLLRVVNYGGGILGVDEDSTEIIDDYTVEITPVRTNLRVIEQNGHPSYSVVAPDTEVADERIGTGPFREVEYTPEDRHVVEANPDYWGIRQGLNESSSASFRTQRHVCYSFKLVKLTWPSMFPANRPATSARWTGSVSSTQRWVLTPPFMSI